ncbi:MAG TPA: hypothetical protein VGF52_06355 [Tepidisphaeraceae bacterium]
MALRLRAPNSQDWDAILRCANASLPWQPKGNDEWLQNRMQFDAGKFKRRHYVVEDDAQIVAYGSIEGGPIPERYRVFIVMDARLLPTVGEILYQQLENDLNLLGASIAWVREEARDTNVLDFFRNRGFVGEKSYRTPDGLEVVTLERLLHAAQPHS